VCPIKALMFVPNVLASPAKYHLEHILVTCFHTATARPNLHECCISYSFS
jgi:hypothetical protein